MHGLVHVCLVKAETQHILSLFSSVWCAHKIIVYAKKKEESLQCSTFQKKQVGKEQTGFFKTIY